MINEKLTGRTHHRLHKPLFGKPLLVLQVEVHVTGYECTPDSIADRAVDHTIWRDARVEDIPEILNYGRSGSV